MSHDDGPSCNLTPVSEEEQTYAQFHTGLLNPAEGQPHKLLGVLWDSLLLVDLAELLNYAISLPVSKRSILKSKCKIFDPLGLLSPFVVKLKLLFRSLCSDGVN